MCILVNSSFLSFFPGNGFRDRNDSHSDTEKEPNIHHATTTDLPNFLNSSSTATKIPETNISVSTEPQNIKKLSLSLDPDKKDERAQLVKEAMAAYDENFGSLDMEKSYLPLFQLLWYSQMPCVDVREITSNRKDELSFLKRCYWKNNPISCNAIFQKRPTDRGMCCSFNMEKAEHILKNSSYTKAISLGQGEEKVGGFETEKLPSWYITNYEPTTKAGRNKGLTLIVDRHSDRLSPGTVTENFQGFFTIVDGKDRYPLTSFSDLIARPGYETNMKIKTTKVQSLREIRQYGPEKRHCYFSDEFVLKMHQNYSQSNCILECRINFAFKCMKTCMKSGQVCDCGTEAMAGTNDSCIPWFYPVPDNEHIKMCNPWNTAKFQKILSEDIPNDECIHCLADCTTTVYETSISYAKFQECDHTNIGVNRLCDMETGDLNPAPWTYLAQKEFTSSNKSLPWYLQTNSAANKFSDQRKKSSNPNIIKGLVFQSELKNNPTYNAWEKDIGIVNIYFGNPHSTRYIKKNRMSTFDFLSQVGGSIGLAMGISMVTIVELIYWFTLRHLCNRRNRK